MELSSLVDVDAAPISSTPAGSTATRSSSSSSSTPAVSADLPSLSAILASINAAASALAVPELQLTRAKPAETANPSSEAVSHHPDTFAITTRFHQAPSSV